MYQFILFLGQDSFYPSVKVIMPYQAIVTYNVHNDDVQVVDLTLPFKPIEFMNMTAIQQQAKDAAMNNAIENDYIGAGNLIEIYKILKNDK